MAELPIAPIDRLIRKAGAERVSEEAAKILAEYLEEYAVELAKKAVEHAKHCGRRTVKAEDIKLVIRESPPGPLRPVPQHPRSPGENNNDRSGQRY
ncbi:histone family protein [Thermococcus sp. LS2]|nr:histone family protein [Thermococcus sp. LS2]